MEKLNFTLGISNSVVAVLAAGVSIPLIKEKVAMNKLYGVRFAKSFESDELWYKINKKGGKLLLAWSVPILLIGLLCFVIPSIEAPYQWLFAYAPILYLIPGLQAYLYARKL